MRGKGRGEEIVGRNGEQAQGWSITCRAFCLAQNVTVDEIIGAYRLPAELHRSQVPWGKLQVCQVTGGGRSLG